MHWALSISHRRRDPVIRRLGLCAIAVGILLLGGCTKKPAAKRPPKAEGNPGVPVTVAMAEQKTTAVEVENPGEVEAYASVELRAQVTGVLTDVHFTEGQMVKKGDPLLSIDPRQPQAALKMAQANLERDEAQLRNAEREAARQTQLFQKGFVSQDELDKSTTAVDMGRAAVSADKAAIEDTSLQLDYCSIRSPIDGRTGSLHVQQGNLIRANDISVVTIKQIDPIYVGFPVLEQHLPAIRKAMATEELDVRVVQPYENVEPLHGALSFVDNAVAADTRMIRLRATFANKEHRLWPGQYVKVVLTIDREPNSVVVPSQSVQTGQKNNPFVYVVKADQTVEARAVTVRRAAGSEAVVEGIKAGEVVVTDGQLRLVPGAKVQVKDAPER